MKTFDKISRRCLARLNRRQRKKLRVGEFQEMGFEFELVLAAPMDDAAFEGFFDAFYEQIKSLGLSASLGWGPAPIVQTSAFITAFDDGTVTPALRETMAAWLQARPEAGQLRVGELIDAWHGWGDI